MLMHIIDMAHSIYLKVCIEGIETPDELDKINQMKPDYIQGYYFGRPCSRKNLQQTIFGALLQPRKHLSNIQKAETCPQSKSPLFVFRFLYFTIRNANESNQSHPAQFAHR